MENENDDKVNEPGEVYNKKRLQFFSSFAEEEEAQISYWRNLSHEERMEQHRILSTYAFSHFKKYSGNRLSFG